MEGPASSRAPVITYNNCRQERGELDSKPASLIQGKRLICYTLSMPKSPDYPEVSRTPENRERYKLLFVYAYFKADTEDGVHQDLLSDATVEEGLRHARELYPDADEFRVSDISLPDPYAYLFAGDKFETMRQRLAFPAEGPSREEFEAELMRLDELNR